MIQFGVLMLMSNSEKERKAEKKLFKGGNLEFLLSDGSEFQRGELDWHCNQTGHLPPLWQDEGGGGRNN